MRDIGAAVEAVRPWRVHHTASRGRFGRSAMPSRTLSVIVEMVCRDLGSIDLGQVGLDLTSRQALRRE
ncbi:hypothetical protein RKD18_000313 [Streptomyces phaeoluteigriseus]